MMVLLSSFLIPFFYLFFLSAAMIVNNAQNVIYIRSSRLPSIWNPDTKEIIEHTKIPKIVPAHCKSLAMVNDVFILIQPDTALANDVSFPPVTRYARELSSTESMTSLHTVPRPVGRTVTHL